MVQADNQYGKVSLAGTPRGGILTKAGVLTLCSHPNRTSRVKRVQFILETICRRLLQPTGRPRSLSPYPSR